MINCVECTKGAKCLKFRTETHADNYDFITFFAYVCYFPLYFAGPIMTYNSWLSQVLSPQQSYDKKRLCIYAFRWIVIFGLLLWFIHNLYLPAIANSQYNRHLLFWLNCSELLTVSFFVLKWMWLKFTVIWRFFRIAALLDGIECPENMITCMSNNYCFEGFWRAWHHSFNLWLVRYLFIPLGGKHTKIYNIWIVYGFVGLWHDVSLDMVFWSWGMCLFIVPELLIKSYFSHEKFNAFRNTLVYSWLCVLGSVFCIFLMITANLVGFSYGSEGITPIVGKFISIEGLKAIFRGMIFLTIATHFNRLYREEETRRGIKKKY
jgi:D-alanyl-lipoteichoic acid acyltransferase DltB (MBOAT superfamily)